MQSGSSHHTEALAHRQAAASLQGAHGVCRRGAELCAQVRLAFASCSRMAALGSSVTMLACKPVKNHILTAKPSVATQQCMLRLCLQLHASAGCKHTGEPVKEINTCVQVPGDEAAAAGNQRSHSVASALARPHRPTGHAANPRGSHAAALCPGRSYSARGGAPAQRCRGDPVSVAPAAGHAQICAGRAGRHTGPGMVQ